MITAQEDQSFVLLECGYCGIRWYQPELFNDECKLLGPQKTFFCPNGHARIYTYTTEKILSKDLEEIKRARAVAEEVALSERARAEKAEARLARMVRKRKTKP